MSPRQQKRDAAGISIVKTRRPWREVLVERAPKPPRPSDYPSRLHAETVAARVGLWLGTAFTICFITGLFSHLIQNPPGWFAWPTGPVWLYRLTQGLHVTTGFAAIPLLLVKLWTVSPRFWQWPPVTSVVNALERALIFLLIGAAFFELITGLLNVAEYYPWTFFFPPVHYAIAWVALGSLAIHIAVKLPVIRRALGAPVNTDTLPTANDAPSDGPPVGTSADRKTNASPAAAPLAGTSSVRSEADTERVTTGPDVPAVPDPTNSPRIHTGPLSRRGLLGLAAGSALVTIVATVGDKISAFRGISVLAQRNGSGPQGLPVNRSAEAAGVRQKALDPAWRLSVKGPSGARAMTLTELKALPQHVVTLPISCVEGWSQTANWTGIRLADMLGLVGGGGRGARLISLEQARYGASDVSAALAADPLTIVALQLEGTPLDIDHGFPARMIAPNRPGVLQTKWLSRIEVL